MPGPDHRPEHQADVTSSTVGAAAIGLFGAWIAAGSTGILAEPLRVALTWLALGLAAALAPPKWRWRPVLCIGAITVLPMFARTGPVHEVLLVAAFLALLADGHGRAERKVFLLCSWATFTLGLYLVACYSVPNLWLLASALGDRMGHVAGAMTGQPLTAGAAFGGIDFLVLMAAFYFGWLASTQGPRLPRAVLAAVAILVGHFLYLSILTLAPAMAEWLPTLPPPTFQHPYVPPPWDWAESLRQLLPWNLPAIGALIQATIAGFMLRWTRWQPAVTTIKQGDARSAMERTGSGRKLACAMPMVLAVALAASSTLSWGGAGLRGQVLVANQHGHLDWLKPRHDHYGQQSAGQFGMLPLLVESMGGRLEVSPVPEEDLANCDVLLLLHPANPWSQTEQDRIWDFVRRGGALLLVAAPIDQPGGWISRYNELLSPTAIRIREDVAISATGNWQHACQNFAHPATTAINPRDGSLFSDAGASLQIGWPARPLVVGRWGWSDPGSDAILSGVYRWEAGERLGDLVLAAEQPFGQGNVVVLGGDFNLTSEGLIRGYDWAGRLLSNLASKGGSPVATWRQAVSLLLCLALSAALRRQNVPCCLMGTAVVLAVALALCGSGSRSMTRVVPDGRLVENQNLGSSEDNQSLPRFRGSRLAYLDASHLEAYSNRDWAFDAVNGLALNLMRSGFLPLMLPRMDHERLERAAIVVSMAPARRFSRDERRRLHEFVHGGGVLISTTGAEEARASQSLLADFGLRVPLSPVPTAGNWREPEPMGNFRSLYLDARDYDAGDYKVGVPFHAGWPVEMTGEQSGEQSGRESEVLVYGQNDLPIVVCRHVGQGKVVLIGDTGFAMNKNLEYIGGEPFAGGYENAHFWRWLISRMMDQDEWIPPPAKPETDNPETREVKP